MKQIQWFPGHMTKALKEIRQNLKLVDVVLELRDARAPISSHNPKLQEIIGDKKHVVVLTKKDLSDNEYTQKWVQTLVKNGSHVVAFDVHQDKIDKLVQKCDEILSEKFAKDYAKGMKKRPMKAMIIGVPNVGKSTLINRISNKRVTVVGNKPGVTKMQQWIRVHKQMELLDTPGVLWPKFENPEFGMRLAVLGTIKDTIVPIELLAIYGIDFLNKYYPGRVSKRFSTADCPIESTDTAIDILEKITRSRGMLVKNSEIDLEHGIMVFLNEFRGGKLGRLTLDRNFEELE
ncbi:ribosome biogenesis GTPase A [Erysipelotrichaceae bacterium]|nr:ribosome biogenesis GTPase A [Erysipelotrichaceae bacterium]